MAFAVNSVGVAYSNLLSFKTSGEQGTGLRKADFPGGPRYSAAGFSIGTKVYLGLGYDENDNSRNDFWKWGQETDVWTQRASFGCLARSSAFGVSIGDKGYIGIGGYGYMPFNDFWEYNPGLN
jgi:N-acetylneuraminic acid mutarotase